jgi:hypothetical protein
MGGKSMRRRRVDFKDLSDVCADARELNKSGWLAVGRWDLSQVCNHLADATEWSVKGFPLQAPWLVRRFFGPWAFRKVLKARRLRAGVKVPDKILPQSGGDADLAIDRLEQSVQLFDSHCGPMHEHPILGRLDKEAWRQFHLIHGGHHLSFLSPQSAATAQARTT